MLQRGQSGFNQHRAGRFERYRSGKVGALDQTRVRDLREAVPGIVIDDPGPPGPAPVRPDWIPDRNPRDEVPDGPSITHTFDCVNNVTM